MASNRALLLDWHGSAPQRHPDGNEIVSFPPVDTLLQPPGLQWSYDAFLAKFGARFAAEDAHHVLDLDDPVQARAMLCDDLRTLLPRPVVHLRSWDWFFPLLRVNPATRALVRAPYGTSPAREQGFRCVIVSLL